MVNGIKRIWSILRNINIDTHLWCVSVLCGAVLLCVSFFVEPSSRQVVSVDETDVRNMGHARVIEYSSVFGGLSRLEALAGDEVDEIAQSIPEVMDDVDSDPVTEVADEKDAPDALTEYANVPENAAGTAVAAGLESVDISNVYSAEAVDALERLVQCEASAEDADGKALVASVVLNRVDTGIWGDDILSVIEAPGQFEPVDNGAYKIVDVDTETVDAVLSALLDKDISKGALYFQKSTAKVWGDKQYLFRHGSHSFYR